MYTSFNQNQIDWLLDRALTEGARRASAYPNMIERGALTRKNAEKYRLRWSYICLLLRQASGDNYKRDAERPIVLKMDELKAAIAEATREYELRKKFYSKRTKEGTRKLVFCEKLIELLNEQKARKLKSLGVQTNLFNK